MNKNSIYPMLLLAFVILFGITSCEEQDQVLNYAPPFSNMEYCYESFEGNDIPFKIVDIDADNYSLINSICMTINDNGTWNSVIDNTQVVDGVTENSLIERNGTYSSGGAMALDLTNEDEERGRITYVMFGIPTGTTQTYRISFVDNEGNDLTAFVDVRL